ncbi:MAG TPA: hypothetical protein VK178_00940 [Opitutaceae bacterium]|nr:hypothetical protein [Opitutaceae bacterium]
MTLRAYLTLLRPWKTLPLGLIYSYCFGLFFLRNLGNCTAQEAIAIACVIVCPLVFGDLLAGPAHELMNSSLQPLLPNARHALRFRHLQALTATAMALVVGSFLAPEYPLPARLGLIIGGLALPLLNTRRVIWPYLLLPLLIAPLFAPSTRDLLLAACQTAPWLFLSLGLLCGALCIGRVFSAAFAREYWRAPAVLSVQTLAPFYDTTVIQRRREDEERRAIAKGRRPTREWATDSVGTSLRDWARVIRHARFGGASWIWSGPGTVVFGALPILINLALPVVFGIRGDKGYHSLPELCRQVLAAAQGAACSESPVRFAFQSLPCTSMMVAMYAASVSALQTTRFPISRRRLADCLFAEILRISGLCCAGFALGTLGPIIGAALFTQSPIEFALFSRALRHLLILPTVALLGVATIYVAVRYRWIASFGGYLLSAAVSGTLGGLAMAIAESRLGVFIWLPSLLLSAWLARAAVRRYYATNDLNRLMPWAARFAGRTA